MQCWSFACVHVVACDARRARACRSRHAHSSLAHSSYALVPSYARSLGCGWLSLASQARAALGASGGDLNTASEFLFQSQPELSTAEGARALVLQRTCVRLLVQNGPDFADEPVAPSLRARISKEIPASSSHNIISAKDHECSIHHKNQTVVPTRPFHMIMHSVFYAGWVSKCKRSMTSKRRHSKRDKQRGSPRQTRCECSISGPSFSQNQN